MVLVACDNQAVSKVSLKISILAKRLGAFGAGRGLRSADLPSVQVSLTEGSNAALNGVDLGL